VALGEESGEERCGAQPIATVRGIKAGGIGTDCCGEGEEGGHDIVMRMRMRRGNDGTRMGLRV